MQEEAREQVQPGDTVIRVWGIHPDSYSLNTVQRVTATQIVLDNGYRYSRSSGLRVQVQDKWSGDHIRIPHPEDLEEARERIRVRRLREEVAELVSSHLRKSSLRELSPQKLADIRAYLQQL